MVFRVHALVTPEQTTLKSVFVFLYSVHVIGSREGVWPPQVAAAQQWNPETTAIPTVTSSRTRSTRISLMCECMYCVPVGDCWGLVQARGRMEESKAILEQHQQEKENVETEMVSETCCRFSSPHVWRKTSFVDIYAVNFGGWEVFFPACRTAACGGFFKGCLV